MIGAHIHYYTYSCLCLNAGLGGADRVGCLLLSFLEQVRLKTVSGVCGLGSGGRQECGRLMAACQLTVAHLRRPKTGSLPLPCCKRFVTENEVCGVSCLQWRLEVVFFSLSSCEVSSPVLALSV